jgi:DNA sulfur modification protein DndB
MSNLTLIPALRCKVDTWRYYICRMKYAEVAREIQFPHELGSNAELGQLIQRGISNRTKAITEYLLKSKHRFLGGLVVAAWAGDPQYTQLQMDDPDGMLKGLDQGFGVLTFDGTQSYFVLDGQHRLRSIKDALKKNPDLGKDDICVLIVTHYDTPEGRVRTRRLFSNINRNAKQTGAAENIALDEDDGYAILTRRILEDHPFLKDDGRVRVILAIGEDGELKLASGSVPKTDARAITTFTVLYDLFQYLGWDQPGPMRVKTLPPSDEVLDDTFKALTSRIDDLLTNCGGVQAKLEAAASAREVRAPKGAEGDGHPFMRPVVQKAVARVASEIVYQGLLSWEEVVKRLAGMDWKLASCPWQAVAAYSPDGVKMLTGKNNTELLCELLHVHLAPSSQQAIKRARKNFKEVRGSLYPVSEEELAKRLPAEEPAPPPAPIELPTEISAESEPEAAPAEMVTAEAATLMTE